MNKFGPGDSSRKVQLIVSSISVLAPSERPAVVWLRVLVTVDADHIAGEITNADRRSNVYQQPANFRLAESHALGATEHKHAKSKPNDLFRYPHRGSDVMLIQQTLGHKHLDHTARGREVG